MPAEDLLAPAEHDPGRPAPAHQYSFDLGGQSEAGKIFQGVSPSGDGTMLDASEQAPEGAPLTIAPERPEEFSPGADAELRALIEATAEMELADIDATFGRLG